MPQPDSFLTTTEFRKPTNTDQYLQWDSHHTISAKYNVVSILSHRAKAVYSNQQLLQQAEYHLQEVLSKCRYPMWALNRESIKNSLHSLQNNNSNSRNMQRNTSSSSIKKAPIVVPYTKGLSGTQG